MGLILGLGGACLALVLVVWLRKPAPPKSRGGRRPAPAAQEKRKQVEHDGPFATRVGHGKATHAGPVNFEFEPESEPEVWAAPEALSDFTLARLESLDARAMSHIARICAAMPAPHPITRMLASGLDTPEELKEAVVTDAGLTASILRTVNSAAFALASPITSVQHAITYLGVTVVKGLVVQATLAKRSDEGTPEQLQALKRIWRSAFIASGFAQVLAQELGEERPSVLATKSLFFNLGDVALLMGLTDAWQWYEEGVTLLDRIKAQQAACGGNTAIVGSELATLWNLPEDLAEAIEKGYLLLATPPADHGMDGKELRANLIVYLAGRIGDQAAYFGLRDVADMAIETSDDPSVFYLPVHLQTAGLERVPALLQDPAFRRKANRLITRLAT
jgi:hypothetical protein